MVGTNLTGPQLTYTLRDNATIQVEIELSGSFNGNDGEVFAAGIGIRSTSSDEIMARMELQEEAGGSYQLIAFQPSISGRTDNILERATYSDNTIVLRITRMDDEITFSYVATDGLHELASTTLDLGRQGQIFLYTYNQGSGSPHVILRDLKIARPNNEETASNDNGETEAIAGQRLQDRSLGLSAVVPEGWTGEVIDSRYPLGNQIAALYTFNTLQISQQGVGQIWITRLDGDMYDYGITDVYSFMRTFFGGDGVTYDSPQLLTTSFGFLSGGFFYSSDVYIEGSQVDFRIYYMSIIGLFGSSVYVVEVIAPEGGMDEIDPIARDIIGTIE